MFSRSLPPFLDLRAFVAFQEEAGALVRVAAPVDVDQEAAEIHRRIIAAGGPVLRFDRPVRNARPSEVPLVVNLFGTTERVAAGLGTDVPGLAALGELLAFLRAPRPPATLGAARGLLPALRAGLRSRPRITRETVPLLDVPPDLDLLPVQTLWPGDAGPLITWPVVVTRPPGPDDPAGYNLGVYRVQVLSRDRAILRWLPARGGAAHHRMWAAAGRPMPVAVVVGADPATMLAAVMPAPEDVTELALAGVIGGRRPDLVPCRTIPLHVPARAEIILEGWVMPGETAMEGPFGDHTGYYNAAEPYPVLRLSHLGMRQDPLYLSTFTGRAPDEPAVIGAAMNEVFKPLLKQAVPEIRDIHLPPEACSYRIAVLSIDKRYPGQARRVMMGLWSMLPQFSMTKLVIVVDDDIDIRRWDDVMWAVATRMDPARDLAVIDRTPMDPLDFASPIEGLGGKLGIDATRKIGAETTRAWCKTLVPDAGIARRVDARWPELFRSNGKLHAE